MPDVPAFRADSSLSSERSNSYNHPLFHNTYSSSNSLIEPWLIHPVKSASNLRVGCLWRTLRLKKKKKFIETEVILSREMDAAYLNWLSLDISFQKEKSELNFMIQLRGRILTMLFLSFAKDVWAEDLKTYFWIKFWLSSQNRLMKWKQWNFMRN